MEADLAETDRNLESLNSQKKQLTLDSGELQKYIDEVRCLHKKPRQN